MSLTFACPHCGHGNHAGPEDSGRSHRCDACGGTSVVPARSRPAGGSVVTPAEVLKFTCPGCGRHYGAKPSMVGKTVRCDGCGGSMVVRPDPSASNAHGSRIGAGSPSGSSVTRRAPRLAVDPSVLAAVLGTDDETPVLTTAPPPKPPEPPPPARVMREEPEVVESVLPPRSETFAHRPTPLSGKAKHDGHSPKHPEATPRHATPKASSPARAAGAATSPALSEGAVTAIAVIGGAVGAAAVLGPLGYAFPALRMPVGGLLAVAGLAFYGVGTLSVSRAAAAEGPRSALLCKVAPFYKWYYLYQNWALMKGRSLLLFVGLVLIVPGAVLVTTSPARARSGAPGAAAKTRVGTTPRRAPTAKAPRGQGAAPSGNGR